MKFFRIVVPIILIFILGISCFASPGYDRGSSYSNRTPDSGYIEVQTVDYNGYAVNRFVLGGYGDTGMYSVDGISVSNPTNDGVYWSMDYSFNHGVAGVKLSIPIAFMRLSNGELIPNSFANVTFNKDVYCFVEFKVLEADGTLASIVQEHYISANTPIKWLNGIPSGTNTVVDYSCTITFSDTITNGLVINYTDSYTNAYSNTLKVLVANNNYDSGYNQGILDGEVIGRDKGYQEGYNAGLEEDTFSGFGTFMTTVLGGFLNTPFIGGITIGGILLAFVGFAVALWLLKLLAGG